ncbi:MAG: hypothetical protein ACTHNW_06495 [Mucilaginibacter sp.]
MSFKPAKLKYHSEPLQIIRGFNDTLSLTIRRQGSPLDGLPVKLLPYRKGFELVWPDNGRTFHTRKYKLSSQIGKLNLCNKNHQLVLEDPFIFAHRYDRESGPVIAASGGYLHSKGFSKTRPYYFQVIIPTRKKLDIYFSVERHSFATDLGFTSITGTCADFAGDHLQLCIFEHDHEYYISIDAAEKQAYGLFSKKVHALKNAIGYLTGFLPADAGWFFAYTKQNKQKPVHLYHTEWRNSVISMYQPLYANPFGYTDHKKIAQRIYDNYTLRTLSNQELNTLCQRLYDSQSFTGIIILMLEASVASLLFMPGGFAIAMESLADLITGPVKEKLAPIKTPALSKHVRKACAEIIRTACADLPQADVSVLLGRIDQLNQVTNKSRLRQPFEQLGIPLSEADLYILQTRNDFLHGRIPDVTGAGEGRSEQRRSLDLYYAALRFYTLLNRLILKWIGYDNYVLNHPKLNERTTLIKLKEPYYIKD